MTLLPPAYHFGLVVPDLGGAQDELTRALGLSWARTQCRDVRMDTARGLVEIEVCFVYSREGPPYLELIEQRPDSPFAEIGLHHIAVWTDDAHAESSRLEAEGWPRESVTVMPDGAWVGGLYHTGTCGLRVEVVDIGSSGPKLVRYLEGGDYA